MQSAWLRTTPLTAQSSVSVQRRCDDARLDALKLSAEGWRCASLIAYLTFLALRGRHVVPALANRNEFLTTTTRSQPIALLSLVSEAARVANKRRKWRQKWKWRRKELITKNEIKKCLPTQAMSDWCSIKFTPNYSSLEPKMVILVDYCLKGNKILNATGETKVKKFFLSYK